MSRQDPSAYVLGACVAAMLLFGLIGALASRTGGGPVLRDQPGSAASVDASAAPVQWEFGANETCNITGEARVRSAPSGAASLAGTFQRGASVACRPVTNKEGWYIIDSGGYAGSFMAQNAVSQESLPGLDTSYSGKVAIQRSGYLYAAPDTGSRVLQNLEPPLTLSLVGKTGNGLFEIRMKTGGAGYVPAEIFETSGQ